MGKKSDHIAKEIIAWSLAHPRDFPWKKSKDPYRIWVSEIILQQTRVEQGLPYYKRFIKKYPNVFALARASQDELMKTWEGLGYYRRAIHMQESAQFIAEHLNGNFPSRYDEILALKGVGPYTAAAIASFAFELPFAVVDGNVIRLISRYFGLTAPVDQSATKRTISQHVQLMIENQTPSVFNQAIMDFGSLVCKPKNPNCNICPINKNCWAKQENLQHSIPQKTAKRKKKIRHFYYLVPRWSRYIYIRRRSQREIWPNLFEFYLVEAEKPTPWEIILSSISLPVKSSSTNGILYTQTLSHQIISARFMTMSLEKEPDQLKNDGFMAVNPKKIRNFAFPRVIDCYLGEKELILDL